MRKKIFWQVLTLIALVVIMMGCVPMPTATPEAAQPQAAQPQAAQPEAAKPEEKPAAEMPKEVKVGVLIPLTGAQAATGENLKRSHDLAAKLINEAGGIKSLGGAKLTLVYGDTQGDAAIGTNEAERLINQEGVIAIMGAFNSSVTYPSTEVAERYKVPYLVPNSIMDEITQRGFKYTFRMERVGSLWSKDQIDFITWLNKEVATPAGKPLKTLGLVYEDTDHGKTQGKSWKKYGNEAGFEVVLDQPYPKSSPDLTPIVLKIKSAKPDVVLFVSYISDAILMFKTLAEQRADATVYLSSSAGYSDPSFIKEVGPLANYLFDLTEWTPDLENELARKYNAIFKEEYGNDMNGAGAFCFSATYVLYDAIERAASTSPDAVRDALAATNISEGPATIIPWKPLQFDETGQMKNASMLVVQYQDGVRRSVWPPEIASAKPMFPMPSWEERLKQ